MKLYKVIFSRFILVILNGSFDFDLLIAPVVFSSSPLLPALGKSGCGSLLGVYPK